jgi:hypothetical protein
MTFEDIRQHLRRTEWGDFPDVVIVNPYVRRVKNHPLYASSKEGDARAAEGFIEDVVATDTIDQLTTMLRGASLTLLAVHALESEGMNAIPRVFARWLSSKTGLPVASGIIQINRVTHTGADGYHRLAFPAVFNGDLHATVPNR